jgi:hypothetical protein
MFPHLCFVIRPLQFDFDFAGSVGARLNLHKERRKSFFTPITNRRYWDPFGSIDASRNEVGAASIKLL